MYHLAKKMELRLRLELAIVAEQVANHVFEI